MQIGIRTGSQGNAVARLHRVLTHIGWSITVEEVESQTFGATTETALREFQARYVLAVSGFVDEVTLPHLERWEGHVLATPPTDPAAQPRARVRGRVVDANGASVRGARVSAWSARLRAERELGLGTTDKEGAYVITFAWHEGLALKVRALDAAGCAIAESAPVFRASRDETVNLTTASDGIIRAESVMTSLFRALEPQLHETPLLALREDKDVHELSFLAGASGTTFNVVAKLYLAHALAAAIQLAPATIFALLYQHIPASLEPALAALPDTGLDESFARRAWSGVLAQPFEAITSALRAALAANVVPASYSGEIEGELVRLKALFLRRVGDRAWVRGKTPLRDLLATGKLSGAVQERFLQIYADNLERPRAFWKIVKKDPAFSPQIVDQIKTTLTAGELLSGHLPLIDSVLGDVAGQRVSGLRDLAKLDKGGWARRLREVDPDAAQIKPMLPDETPDQRIVRFGAILEARFESRFPTAAFAARLDRAPTEGSAIPERRAMAGFLQEHAALDLARMSIDRYVVENKVEVSAPTLDALKMTQRLFRLAPRYAAVEAMAKGGFASAQSIYFQGKDAFSSAMKETLGATRTELVYRKAELSYAAALALFGRYNLALNGAQPAVIGAAAPTADQLDRFPNVQSLFGSLDFCECPDCRSVTSPAAYYVDLLQFLRSRAATGGHAIDVLFERRADLAQTALSCANTQVVVPYIDLVNEVLEDSVTPPVPVPTIRDTVGTTAERRAVPQTIRPEPYARTAAVAFPLTLPFDLAFAEARAFLGGMGSSRGEIMAIFAGTPGPSDLASANDLLGMNDGMASLAAGTDAFPRWERWGLAAAGNNLVHPRFPADPTHNVHGDWITVLGRIPILLARTGLDMRGLTQMLESSWVTAGAVTLEPGKDSNGILLCDTDVMSIHGLTADVLDRMQRFLRLGAATGWTMWDLDSVLDAGKTLAPADLMLFLGRLRALSARLSLSAQELLAFWATIPAKDAISHLGDEDEVVPSLYAATFRSPTLRAWSAVFVANPTALAGQLGDESVATGLTAALGLSAADIATIIARVPLAGALTLDSLSALFRVARVSGALGISVADLFLYEDLTGKDPFASPGETLEFLRRFDVLQKTSLSVVDLDYLLRDGSAERSALAFTSDAAQGVLSDFRGALDKLSTENRTDGPVQQLLISKLAAALAVNANVVDPALHATGALPLSAAQVTELLQREPDGTFHHDEAHFVALLTAFTRVAKAASLFTALKLNEQDLAFLIIHALDFHWLDPASLPTTAAAADFDGLERLLAALDLQRVKRARSPKLFDILGKWSATAPATASLAYADLADALSSDVTDVRDLAVAIGATTTASLRDVNTLAKLGALLAWARRWGVRGSTAVVLGAAATTLDVARAARSTFEAQYDPSQWLDVIQPIEDDLRQARRDALVAYLLAPDPTAGSGFTSTDQIFGHYLIDPEMCACMQTTRLKQGASSIQQFVQRCFLNLEPRVRVDTATDSAWKEWTWMKHYRLWEANRKVFLYPENYLLPELRRDKSPFFGELEKSLLQADLDADSAEEAFKGYLDKVVDVSRLVVAAHYQELKPDGSRVLHIFAHTRGTPQRYFYRTREELPLGHGRFTAWQKLDLDIQGKHLVPVMWNRRLHLVWATFAEKAQAEGDQSIPVPGESGMTAKAPKKFWTMELAMSELRGKRWIPKKTFREKAFLTDFVPVESFTLRASVEADNSLSINVFRVQLQVKVDGDLFLTAQSATQIVRARLDGPDSALRVLEGSAQLPANVDVTQEPSFLEVEPFSGTATISAPLHSTFDAQDFIHDFGADRPMFGQGTVFQTGAPTSLFVKQVTGSSAQLIDVKLLDRIIKPRTTAAQPAAQFDSTDPFFVAEGERSFFVQPHYFSTGSAPTEFDLGPYVKQWSTQYGFLTFYHPFASLFVRELNIGGVDQLMRRELQVTPDAVKGIAPFDFNARYGASGFVTGYAKEAVDFTADGAYSLYNWEVFYHAPMLVAARLMQAHRHEEAMGWLEYIFDPTDSSDDTSPRKYWRTKPFYEREASDYLQQRIDELLALLAADKAAGVVNQDLLSALDDWRKNPFDPHRIAGLRTVAYQRATVMKFIDNLIAWGDLLFSQDTMETINEAAQLYVLASMLLGPKPESVRMPSTSAAPLTWNTIAADVDAFSNALVDVENLIPPIATGPTSDGAEVPPLPRIFTGNGKTLYFCIPPNQTLLGYWDTVADRLFKIRHCMNLAGVVRQLPLYEPPIDPLLLAKAAAVGVDLSTVGQFKPIYRYNTYHQKALELANDVRSFGGLVLGALEKKDGEALGVLRSSHELSMLRLIRDVKEQQIKEAEYALAGARKQKEVVTIRRDYYRDIKFMNEWEITAMSLQGAALLANGAALILDMTSGVAHVVPKFALGASGFGGTPHVAAHWGGDNLGKAATSWASVARGVAGLLSEGAQMTGTLGGYQRRKDDWEMQRKAADKELTQIAQQIAGAEVRAAVAKMELANHDKQIESSASVDEFLNSKYTNAELYDWMLGQLSTLHAQAHQLAVTLAKKAQSALQYELGVSDEFVQAGTWDSQRKGLLAAESLLFDLRRMEAAYLDENQRELELTKNVSIALTQPDKLVRLRQTGTTDIVLDEELFDRDHPGHYFRRIKSVALTIPCVTGPYAGVNATLVLDGSTIRDKALLTPAGLRDGGGGGTMIATSSGQNDAGLFELNLRDDRYLPFEGRGAVSTWTLSLPPEDNSFDLATITDVVVQMRYTARAGLAPDTVRTAIRTHNAARAILVSASQTFGDAYYRFFNPDDVAAPQRLELAFEKKIFPYSSLGSPRVSRIRCFVILEAPPAAGTTFKFSLGLEGAAAAALPVATSAAYGASLSGELAFAPTKATGSWALTLDEAEVPAGLARSVGGAQRLNPARVRDILFLIEYQIT